MARRYYRNGQATSLAFPVGALDTTIQVNSATSFPTQYPYTLILEPDGALEEVVDVTNGTGSTLTVSRGVDGTTASAHSAGVQVYHGVSARDPDEANAHVNATTNVHGTSGSLVDTASTQSIPGAKDFSSLKVAGSPVADTTSNQTIGGTKTFTSAPTFSGGTNVTGAETHTGTETHSGAETHSGTETHNGAVQVNNNLTVTGTLTAKDAIFSTNYSGTTDSQGFVTITHGAGFTPTGGWAVTTNPSASFAVFWGVDSITATTIRLRFMNGSAAGPLAGLSVLGRLFLVRP